ncbi:MAG: Sir2 family NAD-dependent protein deacetylase [Chlamydiota bacterium]|nr:Sir2 family NAD-dependent protein deacetylase [Chlamydiota bacterium]
MKIDSNNNLSQLIAQSNRVLIFTGAGISTHSGIPDFRGPNGIWKKHQPVYYQDFLSREEARIAYWNYKLECWMAFRDALPNRVHEAIVELEHAGKLEMLVTQNIDGLHKTAGTSASCLVELHGTNHQAECQQCYEKSDPAVHYHFFREKGSSPRCRCGGYIKIATISFGQNLRQTDLIRAQHGARNADLVIALGSTLSVYPAASICLMALEKGTPYIIINQGPTEHDHLAGITLRLDGDVLDIFPPAVNQALKKNKLE